MNLKNDAELIVKRCIERAMPDKAVKDALKCAKFGTGDIYMVSVGKAAWQMAKGAMNFMGDKIKSGVVITKYGHVGGELKNTLCYEAGHPVPDDNTFSSTKKAIELVSNLTEHDTVIFLLSGGGSALFEDPIVCKEELEDITQQFLKCGADITEINTVRKRISKVKGGRFAEICMPAKVFSIVLSDIIGDPLDMIASGPCYPDSSTEKDALGIIKKYNLKVSNAVLEAIAQPTPRNLPNVTTNITGSVRQLCKTADATAKELGYETIVLTDCLDCEAKEAGRMLGSIARYAVKENKSVAYIMGGETIVNVKGTGKGGRNQELSLAAADYISGMNNVTVFSFGSDGTDGPTDAAGGIVDGNTKISLANKEISVYDVLENNDAYNALKLVDGLIITGPTGTNVNDISMLLIK